MTLRDNRAVAVSDDGDGQRGVTCEINFCASKRGGWHHLIGRGALRLGTCV